MTKLQLCQHDIIKGSLSCKHEMFQTHNSHLVFIGFTVPEVYKQEASGLQTEAAKLDLMSLITVNIFLLQ